MDVVPASSVGSMLMPRLGPFFEGLGQRYCDTKEDLSVINAEQLVDGMNLDGDWCKNHMSSDRCEAGELRVEFGGRKTFSTFLQPQLPKRRRQNFSGFRGAIDLTDINYS